MDCFDIVKAKIKIEENYLEPNYKKAYSLWEGETWKQSDLIYQILDGGYTERIIIPLILEVVKNHKGEVICKSGSKNLLRIISERL